MAKDKYHCSTLGCDAMVPICGEFCGGCWYAVETLTKSSRQILVSACRGLTEQERKLLCMGVAEFITSRRKFLQDERDRKTSLNEAYGSYSFPAVRRNDNG